MRLRFIPQHRFYSDCGSDLGTDADSNWHSNSHPQSDRDSCTDFIADFVIGSDWDSYAIVCPEPNSQRSSNLLIDGDSHTYIDSHATATAGLHSRDRDRARERTGAGVECGESGGIGLWYPDDNRVRHYVRGLAGPRKDLERACHRGRQR